MPTADASAPRPLGARSRTDVTAIVALVATVGWFYGRVAAGLWSDWLHDENYAHGIVVVPAMCWLIWRSRAALAATPVAPSWAGSAIAAFSLGLFLLGQAAVEFYLTRISLLGVVAGAIVQLLGWRHLRLLAFPLTVFALAIPLPAVIFNQLAFPLQLLASRIGVAMLSLIGIPVVREGNIIVLRQATLEVVEACSGVRSLISVLTLALVYGYLTAQRLPVRAAILASAVPVVIVANGLRVAGAGVAAEVYGASAASGFLHTFSGWIFFLVSIALLLTVERGATAVARRMTVTDTSHEGRR